MEASDLLNIEDAYVGDMVSTTISKRTVYVNEASKAFKLPEDMPIKEKEKRVKQYNKEVKKKISLSVSRDRPKLTDMEIALILATHAHTPLEILMHTLNLSGEMIKKVINKYSGNAIPQMPLVMVSDTARYWDKNTVKDSNDVVKLNNPNHPLTAKELLRSTRDNAETDQTPNERGFISNGRRTCSNIYDTTYSEEQSLKVYFERTKGNADNSDVATLAPYKVAVNNRSVVIGGVPDYSNLNNTLLHTMYGVPNNKHNTLLINTDLNTAICRLLNVDSTSTHVIPNRVTTQVMVYNNRLSHTYHVGRHSNNSNSLTRDTIVLHKDYNLDSTHYMYVPYYFVRPHLFDRAHGEPLLTTNRELKYRVPEQLNYVTIKPTHRLPLVKVVVRCNKCNTKMYTSDTKCNCEYNPMIVTYHNTIKQRVNTTASAQYPKLTLPVTTEDVKNFYKYYSKVGSKVSQTKTKSLNNKLQYKYIKAKKYDKVTGYAKQVVAIYTDHDDYSILLENTGIDIKPLYANFRLPIDATLSEPSHL